MRQKVEIKSYIMMAMSNLHSPNMKHPSRAKLQKYNVTGGNLETELTLRQTSYMLSFSLKLNLFLSSDVLGMKGQ